VEDTYEAFLSVPVVTRGIAAVAPMETVRSLAFLAGQKGLALRCQIEPNVPATLVGDPRAFSRVLMNLIANAIKFTDKGGVRVSVRTEVEEGTQVLLHVRVADTGIGIPVAKQASVFDAFVQGGGSSTRRRGGTGLGWPSAPTWSS
jgi:two-component system sensor histidine kinase/response regulator